jgi:predicted permease
MFQHRPYYEANRWIWLAQFAQDLQYSARGLWRSPAFLATAVFTLTVGIALITVAFTVVNAYVLRPYAVRDPNSLHRIAWRSQDGGGQAFRWRDYQAIRERTDLFTDVVAESTRFVSSEGRPLGAALVSDNYFDALGPRIALGRGLARFDAAGAGGDAAVLSHQAWQRLFDADPQVAGRTIDINGHPFVIVGVVDPAFVGLGDSPRDVWLSLTTYAALARPQLIGQDQPPEIEILARLRPGLAAEQVAGALTPVVSAAFDRQSNVRAHVQPQPAPNPLSLQLAAVLAPVFAAFALVLLTACANVSNMMLARAISRQREVAMRLSLGATRGRIVRQMLTEGLLVSCLAGGLGLMAAIWVLRVSVVAVIGTLPPSVATLLRPAPVDLDYRVFGFVLLVVGAATLGFALLPSLQASRLSLTDALRGETTSGRRGARLRSSLVIAQVAVSLVLVIIAVTLGRNGMAVANIALGYETAGVISINVRDDDPGILERLDNALRLDPRVGEVAVTGGNPLFVRTRAVAAAPAQSPATAGTRYTFVSPEYFSILRMPIARGRTFRPEEARSSAHVAIVSEATAQAFWPGEDPVGRTIRIEPPNGRPTDELQGYASVTVIGTVGDVVSGILVDGRDAGHIYLPVHAADPHAIALLARGRSARDLDARALQEIFRRVARDPEVFEALPLDEMRGLQLYPFRAASWVGGTLGLVALLLSVAGLYGVLSYMLGQRTREMGIRLALGATAGQIMRLILGHSARLAAIGAVTGAGVAFIAMKMLSSAVRLQHVTLVDIPAFVLGLAVVCAATALAALQPARRASHVDPARTLRGDA